MPKFDLSQFDDATRNACWEILNHYRQSAERGEQKCKDMYAVSKLDWIRNNQRYWRNVKQGLLWVQRHLKPKSQEIESNEQPDNHEVGTD